MYVYRLNRGNYPNPVGILCKKRTKEHTFPMGIWAAAE
jgi:hypothetical protein